MPTTLMTPQTPSITRHFVDHNFFDQLIAFTTTPSPTLSHDNATSPAKPPYPLPITATASQCQTWTPQIPLELAPQPPAPNLSPHGDKHPTHHNKNPADVKKMTQLPPAAHAPLPPRKNTLANLRHQPHPSPAAWPCSVAWPRTITAPQTPTQTQLLCLVHAV